MFRFFSSYSVFNEHFLFGLPGLVSRFRSASLDAFASGRLFYSSHSPLLKLIRFAGITSLKSLDALASGRLFSLESLSAFKA